MVTNNLFVVIKEPTFFGQHFSFILIANNLYGNTTLYNTFPSKLCVFIIFYCCHLLFYIIVSDFHSNGTTDNNCGHTSTIIKISVCVFCILLMLVFFCFCFCYLKSHILSSRRVSISESITGTKLQ